MAGTDCSTLFIRNKELKLDDEIYVVGADDMPHKKLVAKIAVPNNCTKSPQSAIEEIVVDENDSPPTEYEIRFREGDESDSGFAIVAAKAKVDIVKGTAHIVASNFPNPLFFRVCSGNESYHMTVWNGKPLIGKRIWHSYMSLSYDTVLTCKPADYK